MNAQFKAGDDVYLSAADAVFDAVTGKTTPRDLSGPFVIERVYKSGDHWRLVASVGEPYSRVDACVSQFEPA